MNQVLRKFLKEVWSDQSRRTKKYVIMIFSQAKCQGFLIWSIKRKENWWGPSLGMMFIRQTKMTEARLSKIKANFSKINSNLWKIVSPIKGKILIISKKLNLICPLMNLGSLIMRNFILRGKMSNWRWEIENILINNSMSDFKVII